MSRIIIIAFVIALGLAATAFAKDIDLSACTSDHVREAVNVTLKDGVSAEIQKAIEGAYRLAAAELDSETFESYDGYLAFSKRLTDEELAAIDHFNGRPHPVDTCQVAN